MASISTERIHVDPHEEYQLNFWQKYIFSTDHKVIGMQYLLTGLIMAFVGGYLAYVFRMQLSYPGSSIPLFGKLNPDTYNSFVTMHGTIMIFWVAMPVLLAAFGNFLIPTMIGTDDMAFPTLNMMSYWVFFLSTVLLMLSFFVPGGAFGGGAWVGALAGSEFCRRRNCHSCRCGALHATGL